jgi:hypothetical protein
MISDIPGPWTRLVFRLVDRWEAYLDGICAAPEDPGSSNKSGVPEVSQPPPKGLPAILRALETGKASGSVRAIARELKTSKSTAHRAKRRLQFA